ncbi:hypothetical protein FHX37_1654 [Haloactinospora alba]|uniref:Uncharacterized protein n=1 Tax=Haloactinospora alba TaxID=405555 RepID=A0A543NJ06_9ACTN|nr:hypothetical protein [Haloactinospora alba]TQN31734.1 hypothetical protein FHX37_1654 [Haloactinospora alba]
MFEALVAQAGISPQPSLAEVVRAVHAIPHGRPSEPTAQAVLAEWRGTSSTKHELLSSVVAERWPQAQPRLVHRVYRCTPELARGRFGEKAASAVPENGLWDVHRYLTVAVEGERVTIDVTFPHTPEWDGISSMPVAVGEGSDHEAGPDPNREKRVLEAARCDPAVREPFIAALSA